MRNHILSFIIILLLAIFKVEEVRASSTMNYYSITTFEGLPSNTVSAIKKDASGFIWFGTKVGLCRFDGCEVKTYPLLSEDDIWSIEELDNDTLLLGTVSGLKYFSRKANSTVKLDIPSTIVKSIRKTAESHPKRRVRKKRETAFHQAISRSSGRTSKGRRTADGS